MNISVLIAQMLQSPEDTELRKDVVNEVLKLSYFIPQRKFGLREEDAGEFVLEVQSMLDEILSKYKPEASSFMTYLYLVLEHSVKRFYRRKKETILMEFAAITDYAPLDFTDLDTIIEERKKSSGKKVGNSMMKKLYYTFSQYPEFRRRFLVLALSFLPLMEYTCIADVCRTFRYDLKDTMKLCTALRNSCRNKVTYRDNLETMRNIWWTKILASRTMTAAEKTVDIYREKFDNRIQDLEKFSPKIPYRVVAGLLGRTERTISNLSGDMRFYLIWLLDGCKSLKEPVLENRNIPVRLYWEMRQGKWKEMPCRWEDLPLFRPSEAFDCSLFTEQFK